MNPRFQHDCSKCVFLGNFDKIDLYWCKSTSMPSLDSVIGRWGDDGPDYAASHPPAAFANPEWYLAHAQPWYTKALHLAHSQGLYNPCTKGAAR